MGFPHLAGRPISRRAACGVRDAPGRGAHAFPAPLATGQRDKRCICDPPGEPRLNSLPILFLLFAAGAALVWYAGSKLARYADAIAERTGIGHAVIGVVMLGAITSLPEISTTTVATLLGNPDMAVNNMLGGVAFQVVVIALADMVVGTRALTSTVASPRVILNGVVCIALLIIAAIGVLVGDWPVPLLGVGFFPLLIAGVYGLCVWQLSREVAAGGWKPVEEPGLELMEIEPLALSNSRLALLTGVGAVLIFIGGTAVTVAAERIAEATGADTGVLGLTMLALATSLPELSTAISAVRLGRAELAIGDILGSNMFNVVLILLVDVVASGPPVLGQVEPRALTAALVGVLLTALILIGLVERRDKAVLRMGYDSIAVLVVYAFGMMVILGGASAG